MCQHSCPQLYTYCRREVQGPVKHARVYAFLPFEMKCKRWQYLRWRVWLKPPLRKEWNIQCPRNRRSFSLRNKGKASVVGILVTEGRVTGSDASGKSGHWIIQSHLYQTNHLKLYSRNKNRKTSVTFKCENDVIRFAVQKWFLWLLCEGRTKGRGKVHSWCLVRMLSSKICR